MAISTYLSIITLNVNRLYILIKRQRVAEWTQKQDPYICCLQEIHFRSKDTHRLKVREWKKIFHTNINEKKARVAIFISDKIDFKTKTVMRQRRTLHNDKRIDLRRRYDNCKFMCTQHRSTYIHKANINKHKGRNGQ